MNTTPFEILPELRDYLPPPSPERRDELRALIQSDGARPGSLVVAEVRNKRYLADGHTTHSICLELHLQVPEPIVLKFPNLETVKEWIRTNQRARRNMTPEEILAVQKQNQRERRKRVSTKRKQGTSIRQIAQEEKVGLGTVQRDLEAAEAEGDFQPQEAARVTGRDGRGYQASRNGTGAGNGANGHGAAAHGAAAHGGNGGYFDCKGFEADYGRMVRQVDDLGDFGGSTETPQLEALRRRLAEYHKQFTDEYKRLKLSKAKQQRR